MTVLLLPYYRGNKKICYSVQIGDDGWSGWCFPFWGKKPPQISLDRIPELISKDSLIWTLQGIPFKWNSDERNIAFTSQYDNYPDSITIPINKSGKSIWFLIAGSTNPMQSRIANAEIRMKYKDGKTEKIELIPPLNFWTISGYGIGGNMGSVTEQWDYYDVNHQWPLLKHLPMTVELGKNCRAILLNWNLKQDTELEKITLETLSQEVVAGIMGITIIN